MFSEGSEGLLSGEHGKIYNVGEVTICALLGKNFNHYC